MSLSAVYVGIATMFGAAWWFMFFEGGPQVTYYQMVCSRINYNYNWNYTGYSFQSNLFPVDTFQ